MSWRHRPGTRNLVVTFGLFLLWMAPIGCGQGSPARPSNLPAPPRIQPGPWLIVDTAASRALEEHPIYHQGPAPPKLQARVPVRAPTESVPLRQQYLIVEAVISSEGRVVRARVLRAPEIEVSTESLLEALREWKLQPARLKGEPVAVYFTLTVPIEPLVSGPAGAAARDARRPAGGPPRSCPSPRGRRGRCGRRDRRSTSTRLPAPRRRARPWR